jgi:hypothetical protein
MKPLTVLAMFLDVATPASARIVGACDDQYRELEYAAQRIGYDASIRSLLGGLCCKTILPIRACKIDSKSGVNAQR